MFQYLDYFTFKNIILGLPISYFTLIFMCMINDYYSLKKKKNKEKYKKLN